MALMLSSLAMVQGDEFIEPEQLVERKIEYNKKVEEGQNTKCTPWGCVRQEQSF